MYDLLVCGNKLCTNLWWGRHKSDRLHNKVLYHRRQYKVTFLRTKRTRIQTSKAHDNLYFPVRRAYLVPLLFALVRVMVIFTNSLFAFVLATVTCLGKIYIHISTWSWVLMLYCCWLYPWGKWLGGKTISPYLPLCPAETLTPWVPREL